MTTGARGHGSANDDPCPYCWIGVQLDVPEPCATCPNRSAVGKVHARPHLERWWWRDNPHSKRRPGDAVTNKAKAREVEQGKNLARIGYILDQIPPNVLELLDHLASIIPQVHPDDLEDAIAMGEGPGASFRAMLGWASDYMAEQDDGGAWVHPDDWSRDDTGALDMIGAAGPTRERSAVRGDRQGPQGRGTGVDPAGADASPVRVGRVKGPQVSALAADGGQ